MNNDSTAGIVFARAPSAGGIKTRLSPFLGADEILALYLGLLRQTLAAARASSIGGLFLYGTPCVNDPDLHALAGEFQARLRPQRGSDLGERMANAFAEAFAAHERVIIVGSDCPCLAASDLDIAAARLSAGVDLVLGPAEDGGYYLVGLARHRPELFDDMAWGTATVLEQTLTRARQMNLSVHRLPLRWDIDRPEDVRRYRRARPSPNSH